MGGFLMKTKDQLKLEVVYKIESKKINRSEGAMLLNVSASKLTGFAQLPVRSVRLGIRPAAGVAPALRRGWPIEKRGEMTG